MKKGKERMMLVFAAGGYGIMVLAGAVAAAVPLGLAIWWQVRGRPKNMKK